MSYYVDEVLSEIAFEKRLAMLAEQKKAGLNVSTFCQKSNAKTAERPAISAVLGGVARANA